MHFTNFMDLAGQFKNPLGSGGFTRIHVGEYTYVSVFA
jgi:hypothetical protein